MLRIPTSTRHSLLQASLLVMPHVPASSALARFRVIDLTPVRAGPTACRQLAEVIQLQMPEHLRGGDTVGGQDGSDYQYTHRNKHSVTLNLKEPEGIAVLKQLIATADVVVENFRPDVKLRLGRRLGRGADAGERVLASLAVAS